MKTVFQCLGVIALASGCITSSLAADTAPLAGENWTVPGCGIELIWIGPSTFTMGSPASEPGRGNDETPHQVTLTKGCWIGKYEVTQGQWESVMGKNPSYFSALGPNAPVEQVSWGEAMDYCRKLTEQERAAGRLPAGYEYSLPSEAQWECACRAGSAAPCCDIEHPDDYGWYKDNSDGSTHPVGQKQPNAWGFHDMHGNVWEWCEDKYGSYPSGAVTDPTGPSRGSERVLRGGCWNFRCVDSRSANRLNFSPEMRIRTLGFRIALRPRP